MTQTKPDLSFFNHNPRRRFLIRLASAHDLRRFRMNGRASAALLIRRTGSRLQVLLDVGPGALLLAELAALTSDAVLERRWRQALAAGWQPLELGGGP